jgi:hypothetical protein
MLLGNQSLVTTTHPNRLELSTVPLTKTQILYVILLLDLCYVQIWALNLGALA